MNEEKTKGLKRPRGKDGRFLPKEPMGPEEEAALLERVGVTRTPPKPRMCRVFVRDELAKKLPTVMGTLLDKACRGDLPTLRALWQMAGLDRAELEMAAGKPKRQGKNSIAALLLKKLQERDGGGEG